MLRKNKTQTVSEKIASILTRNTSGQGESSADDQSEEPRVEDKFDEYEFPDARSSDIRKKNVKLLSEQSAKYRGKIATRNELEDEISDSSDDSVEEDENYTDSEEDEAALKDFKNKVNADRKFIGDVTAVGQDSEDDCEDSEKRNEESEDRDLNENEDSDVFESDDGDGEGDEEDDEDDDDVDDDIDSEDANSETDHADGTDIIAETNRQAEVQKGQCVQNQLKIWERLLEMRIRTQKILSISNQLPTPQILKAEQEDNEKLASMCRESVNSVSKLLTTLLQLQSTCTQQFSEQRAALKKTLKRPLPTPDDSRIPLKRYAEHLNTQFQEFKPYRNTVLLKWDDRTKLLTPGAGASAKTKSLTENYDIIRKIENTLQSRATLIKRSQIVKATDNTNAAPTEDAQNENDANDSEHAPQQSLNVELYDDSDFYHQQLRELIEYKAGISVSASEVTKQYVELQKLRQKMKKKVDTRASKGRKLRYTVHNKLVNFMAPDDTTTWTEESKDELYRSLFAA
ncbi:protein Aatf [Eurosta solidaginis]|uniref:protein Aatf n=1 Tax=Eurosta solidaginis TaxID=178769 RepID=UPI003530AC10